MYCIGGKGTMMKVDISVYCRLLRHPEKIEEKNINYFFLGCRWFYFR